MGKGYIHIAIAVFDQPRHFRRARIGRDTFSPHELPIEGQGLACAAWRYTTNAAVIIDKLHQNPSGQHPRSEEHTSELQSLMRISYAVFCLKNKTLPPIHTSTIQTTP